MEASLYEVATAGHAKTHVNRKGEVVTERVRDVTAMKLWLTGNRPRLYRDTHRTEVAHALTPEIGTLLREVRMRRQAGGARELPAETVEDAGVKG